MSRGLQAVYALDLVAMMAGGRFQGVANTFIEAMEADSFAKTDLAPRVGAAKSPSAGVAPVATRGASAPDGVRPKKAKRDRSMVTGRPGSGGGIRRIRMPPLDAFRRDYMETETPVILSGVSEATPTKAACCACESCLVKSMRKISQSHALLFPCACFSHCKRFF